MGEIEPPATPCRTCSARVSPGALVCPACGAEPGAVPGPQRAELRRATIVGVVLAVALQAAALFALSKGSAGGAALAVAVLIDVALFVASIGLLATNRHENVPRAFGFAFLMTTLGLGTFVVAGLFVSCALTFRH